VVFFGGCFFPAIPRSRFAEIAFMTTFQQSSQIGFPFNPRVAGRSQDWHHFLASTNSLSTKWAFLGAEHIEAELDLMQPHPWVMAPELVIVLLVKAFRS
jgi:hypothetical protein